MIEMQLVAVRVEMPGNTPVVLLQEDRATPRVLPIFVGSAEATAIAYAIEGFVPPRPLTHDLICQLLETLGAEVERVVITEMQEGTYFAELHLLSGVGNLDRQMISCRPSDAIAVAARTGASIYADDALMDSEGVMLDLTEILADDDIEVSIEIDITDVEEEQLVSEFKDFVNTVKPEDFSR